jgi:hypothetical protein
MLSCPPYSPDRFVEEMNRRLPSMVGYQEGMLVYLTRPGAPELGGWYWTPADAATAAVVDKALEDLRCSYNSSEFVPRCF